MYLPLLFRDESHHPRGLHSFPTRRSSDLLLGHQPPEAFLVHLQPLLGRHLQGQVDREAVGVVQLERLLAAQFGRAAPLDRKSTRLNSSHLGISYAVFCLKKKNTTDKSNSA